MPGKVAILQARMGSQRFPGKVLADLSGRPVLAHVIARAQKIKNIDAVCVATSDQLSNDAVAEIAHGLGVEAIRGSEHDVLSRFALAAERMNADIIMRLTCDCPLIDPDICAAVLALRDHTGADYASNVIRREWPHGLDCEVFTRDSLDRAVAEANTSYEREHVTPFIRAHAISAAHLDGPGGDAARERWVVDHREDLAFLRALFPLLSAQPGWREIFEVVQNHPDIKAINFSLRMPLPLSGPL